MPLGVVCGIVCAVGTIPRCFMPPSFLRIVTTTATTFVCLIPLSWFFVLNVEERHFIAQKLSATLTDYLRNE